MRAELLGPFELTFEGVLEAMPKVQRGVFALGHLDSAGRFRIERIGREDGDLRLRLQALIGSSNRFKFAPAATALDAFESECELFHRFRPPGNIIHPVRPEGSGWRCPVCTRSLR